MPAVAPFKFTLRQWNTCGARRLVYGENCYSRMVVGEIYKGRREFRWSSAREYSAIMHWSGWYMDSFTSIGDARKWLEDSFREQILGEVSP